MRRRAALRAQTSRGMLRLRIWGFWTKEVLSKIEAAKRILEIQI